MTKEQAIALLREDSQSDMRAQTFIYSTAKDMGAEAIELMAWWFDELNEAGRQSVQLKRDRSGDAWTAERWIKEVRQAKASGK